MPLLTFRAATSGGNNTLTVSSVSAGAPTTVAGDLEVMWAGAGVLAPGVAPTIATPSGWTLRGTSGSVPIVGGAINTRLHLFTKIAAGAGSSATLNAGVNSAFAWNRLTYSGPNLVDDFGQVIFGNAGAGTSLVVSSLTTTQNDALVAAFVSQGAAQSITPPGSMTERVDNATYGASTADEQRPTDGATGTRTFTLPSSADAAWGFAEFFSAYESQSIAFTLDDVTAAFVQIATHEQELAATLDGVAVAVSQTLNQQQALAVTLDGVTVDVAQTSQHPQALAITLDGVDVEINQSVSAGESQSIAFTLDDVSVAIEQGLSHEQSLAIALDGISVDLEQVSEHAQALAATLDGVSVDINQSVAQPEKDQALSIVLDGVGVSINQVGPASVPMGGGFFSYAWRRKLMEEELREQLKELPGPVAEVIERQVIESVDRPKLPSPKELRATLEKQNLSYRQAYQKAMVSLVKEMRQREDDEEEEEAIATAMASLV